MMRKEHMPTYQQQAQHSFFCLVRESSICKVHYQRVSLQTETVKGLPASDCRRTLMFFLYKTGFGSPGGFDLHATHGQIWAPGQVSPTPRSLKQHPGEVPGGTATPRLHQLMSPFSEMVEPSEPGLEHTGY